MDPLHLLMVPNQASYIVIHPETEPSLRSESVPSQSPSTESSFAVPPPLTGEGHHRVRDVERSPEQEAQRQTTVHAPAHAARSPQRSARVVHAPPQSAGEAAREVHAPPPPSAVRQSTRLRPPSVRQEAAAVSPPRLRRRR
ncbi:hypothetical protein N665_0328s0001 [Sinapis alba]|nr:hypothetical protein N665_0328s0001 [Sinapis alba]